MEKTTIITIGKKEFNFSEEAYNLLSEYLKFVKQKIQDSEAYTDFEFQLSVLIETEYENDEKTVTLKTIKDSISILEESEGIKFRKRKNVKKKKRTEKLRNRLFRPSEGKIIAGVCASLSRNFNIDPVFIRIVFVLLTVFKGYGVPIYILLWIIIPDKNRHRRHHSGFRNRRTI